MGAHRFTERGEEKPQPLQDRNPDEDRAPGSQETAQGSPAAGTPERPATAPGEPPREGAGARAAQEAAGPDPRVVTPPGTPPGPVTGSVTDPLTGYEPDEKPATGTGTPGQGEPLLRDPDTYQHRCQEILVDFVDGPRHAVEEADQLLEEVAGIVSRTLEERQKALRSSWQDASGTRTEELRLTLQQYRRLVDHLLTI